MELHLDPSWNEKQLNRSTMKKWSDNPSHHERTLLPRSYILLPVLRARVQSELKIKTNTMGIALTGRRRAWWCTPWASWAAGARRRSGCRSATGTAVWTASHAASWRSRGTRSHPSTPPGALPRPVHPGGSTKTPAGNEGRKEMFYLTMHPTRFIYGPWLRTILIVRKETRCRHISYSFRLATRVLLYAPSHREDSTYHNLCYTSRGALAGTRNRSLGPPHEGSIRWPIAPWANALTTELHLAPAMNEWMNV